ncbi:AMP-dependent synthetase/ligase [Trinorchestia longiramus]|nr:AMP-dependent synthetase/ligase [Trinorchestia longiramus]
MWRVGTITLVQLVVMAILGYIALGGYHTIWLAYMTLPRDLRAGWRYLRLRVMIRWAQGSDYCLADLFERNVTKNPGKVALIWEGKKWTFKQLSEYSNKVADVLKKQGLQYGDCVALVMTNRPEYVATWLGASKISSDAWHYVTSYVSGMTSSLKSLAIT